MSNKLKEVTYLTIKSLKSHDIVLPEKYSFTFENIAKKLEVNLDKEDLFLKDLYQDEDNLNKIVTKTNASLSTLKKSTSDAKKAIANKDQKSLDNINAELSKMQKQIEFLQKELFSDSLTGAYNRKWLRDEYLKNDKFITSGHIAFLDLNKFKIINDNYGHLVGDQVLKYLVKFLNNELNYPGIDIVRYAGDEFIILFEKEQTLNLDIKKLMLQVQKKLSEQKLKSAKINELQFSFSFGLINFEKDQELDNVLEVADELMYKNKQENR